MKFYVLIIAVGASMLSASHLSAYIYSFSNHTNDPLKVGVQLAGVNENFEYIVIEPRTQGNFVWTALGHSRESRNIWKAGFCLQNIHVQTPIKESKHVITKDGEDLGIVEEIVRDKKTGEIKWGPDANVVVKFVQNEGANAILKAAEGFANSLQDLAKDAASAYVNYKTK